MYAVASLSPRPIFSPGIIVWSGAELLVILGWAGDVTQIFDG